jgi:hypothetical protein
MVSIIRSIDHRYKKGEVAMMRWPVRSFVLLAAVALLAGPVCAQEFVDISRTSGVADDGLGKGVAFADIDNDGYVDLYVSNKGGANKLFRNSGNGLFEDITAAAGAGIDDPGFTMGSVFGDYDNDGLTDLYLAKGGRYEIEANRLFRNLGNGKFEDVTEKAGVGLKLFTYSASFVDYDNDGRLDLYCANYGPGAKNVLYRNNGDGTFTDVTDLAGVGDLSWSWMGVWADVNGDNYQDLYVVNGRYPAGEPNRLYLNNGDGTFKDVTREAGVEDPNWGLGAAFADIDNDGDLDLFVSNYVGENGLYLNNGAGIFTAASDRVNKDHQGWGKGPAFGDIDNDGDLDLYEGDCKLANQLYINDGKGSFVDIAGDQPQLQCSTVRTKGTAFADVDNDGDLDLYVVNWGAPNKLYLNDQNDKNWLEVKAVGTVSNHEAVGTRIKVLKDGRLIAVREVATATGFCAQNPLRVHFGLDAGASYDVIAVFPSGIEARVNGVSTGQLLEIVEPAAAKVAAVK